EPRIGQSEQGYQDGNHDQGLAGAESLLDHAGDVGLEVGSAENLKGVTFSHALANGTDHGIRMCPLGELQGEGIHRGILEITHVRSPVHEDRSCRWAEVVDHCDHFVTMLSRGGNKPDPVSRPDLVKASEGQGDGYPPGTLQDLRELLAGRTL